MENSLTRVNAEVVACRKCPRLIEYIGQVAQVKRRAYLGEDYWGKPVPAFGDSEARVLILGLAPAAHGANRTGRMFTGDRSGEWLYRVLHKTGFASQAESVRRDDGLKLTGAYITASARCAPPDNKPLPEEIRNCRPYLVRELGLLSSVRVVVALGKIAFDNYLTILKDAGAITRRSDFPFGHGAEYQLGAGMPALLASYHPSQQNTSTGKLTEDMLMRIFRRAGQLSHGS